MLNLKKYAAIFITLLFVTACGKSHHTSNYNGALTEFDRIGDRVYFALNSYDIGEESHAVLDRLAHWLKTNSSYSITVEGHCDERGTREYNLGLGERRAEAVRKALISKGVDSSRIQTISYGKEKPAVLGENELAWMKNRRGVVVIK